MTQPRRKRERNRNTQTQKINPPHGSAEAKGEIIDPK